MMILNQNQKQELVNKLKFTLNFIVCSNEDLEKLFNIKILYNDKDKVNTFELSAQNTFIYFKRCYESEIEIRYTVYSEEQTFGEECSLIFVVSDKEKENNDVDKEFMKTIDILFDTVTEIERKRQYEKINKSINSLLM